MDAPLTDQSVRATADALAGLLAAPARTGEPNVLEAPGYVRAGGTAGVGVTDAAPGAPLCAMLGEQSVIGWADRAGEATLTVRVPAKAGRYAVAVADDSGRIGTAPLTALGAKKLSISLKSTVAAGRTQVVVVRGLAPAEMGTLSITWADKGSSSSAVGTAGQANRHGVLRFTTRVPHRPGRATVDATGQFRNRHGHASFVVTR